MKMCSNFDDLHIDENRLNENPLEKYINPFHDLFEDIEAKRDKAIFEFLQKNGYKLDKPYNIDQIIQLKKDLEKEDKFVDLFEYYENNFKDNTYTITYHGIPFFNRISNPLSEEDKAEIIEMYKERTNE